MSSAARSPPAVTTTAPGCPPSLSSWHGTACRGRPCGGRFRTWSPRGLCTGYPAAAPLTAAHLVRSVGPHVWASWGLADAAISTHTVIGLLEPHLAEPIAQAAQSIT